MHYTLTIGSQKTNVCLERSTPYSHTGSRRLIISTKHYNEAGSLGLNASTGKAEIKIDPVDSVVEASERMKI